LIQPDGKLVRGGKNPEETGETQKKKRKLDEGPLSRNMEGEGAIHPPRARRTTVTRKS